MKKGILLVAVLSLLALDSTAQKVYKDGDKFIFEAAGMPAGSYHRGMKIRTTDGTNSTLGSRWTIGSEINNARIAYRFEIAASDNSLSATWLDAVNLCAKLPGGNWRLPTQRELQMIWIMHEKLKTLTGFTAFDNTGYFRSATEIGDLYSWFIIFNHGYTLRGFGKTTPIRVRCIRDF